MREQQGIPPCRRKVETHGNLAAAGAEAAHGCRRPAPRFLFVHSSRLPELRSPDGVDPPAHGDDRVPAVVAVVLECRVLDARRGHNSGPVLTKAALERSDPHLPTRQAARNESGRGPTGLTQAGGSPTTPAASKQQAKQGKTENHEGSTLGSSRSRSSPPVPRTGSEVRRRREVYYHHGRSASSHAPRQAPCWRACAPMRPRQSRHSCTASAKKRGGAPESAGGATAEPSRSVFCKSQRTFVKIAVSGGTPEPLEIWLLSCLYWSHRAFGFCCQNVRTLGFCGGREEERGGSVRKGARCAAAQDSCPCLRLPRRWAKRACHQQDGSLHGRSI